MVEKSKIQWTDNTWFEWKIVDQNTCLRVRTALHNSLGPRPVAPPRSSKPLWFESSVVWTPADRTGMRDAL